jgi:polyphosphate kinase 2 (PPK2 family)
MEKFATENNTHILKFFLHVSKEEQKNRFMERINNPLKNWKFNSGDVEERKHWEEYQSAYNEMLLHTSTDYAPWFVIPADKKWYMRRVVSEIITTKLESLNLKYPLVSEKQKEEIRMAAMALAEEGK